ARHFVVQGGQCLDQPGLVTDRAGSLARVGSRRADGRKTGIDGNVQGGEIRLERSRLVNVYRVCPFESGSLVRETSGLVLLVLIAERDVRGIAEPPQDCTARIPGRRIVTVVLPFEHART